MLRVVGFITQDHDPRLITLACLVCMLAAHTSTRLLATVHGVDARLPKSHLLAATVAFATGLWTTHFIALMAFQPNFAFSYSVPLCLLSLLMSIITPGAAFLIAILGYRSWLAIAGGGLILSVGITLMHFIGMASLLLPGLLHYDVGLLAIAVTLGSACTIAAVACLTRQASFLASIFLMLGVTAIHFITTAAVTLDAATHVEPTPLIVSRYVLVIATCGGGLLIVLLALAGSMLERLFTARIATEARRFHMLADATFEGLIFERAGYIIDANRAMCALIGQEQHVLVGAPLEAMIKGMHLRSPPGQVSEHELLRPDGTTRTVEVLWKNGPDPGGHVLAVRDVTREKAVQVQLQRVIQFDALTGLTNRVLFDQVLKQTLSQAAEGDLGGIALLSIDLDFFEGVKERFGAQASDDALVQTARRLVRIVRQTDTVARLGRDEFAIIQPLTEHSADAAALAERIVTELAQPFEVDGKAMQLTASVGVALFPADGATAESLIASAALALRRSKLEGRATWRYFEPGKDMRQSDRRSMANELRVALAESQFTVHYQTFFDAETMEVAGCEALVRWTHPIRGRIQPIDFIPLAEDNGLIIPIGTWALATACAEAATWDKPIKIAVNLSPAQFSHEGLVGSVAEILRQTGLPPSRLELEVTEGTLMADTDRALRVLTELKALGVTIAMDDFGTGYSSLSYLRKFPFDKIKIDRSFISDVDDDAEAETIVGTIIAMGQGLHLAITAEGVETPTQLAMLRAKGCTFVQGFLLARPCSASQLDLSAGRAKWLQPGGASVSAAAPALLTVVPATARAV